MTRKKVKLAFMMNNSSQKATFRKKRKGFMKKYEINKLCDVLTCAIMYSPNKSQPDAWPDHSEVRRLIEQFKNMPEEERNKQMVEMELEKVNKLEKGNRELEIWMAMNHFIAGKPLNDLQFTDLKEMRRMIEEKLKEFEANIKSWKEELAKMNQLLGAQPTVAGENIQNVMQMVPWSMWDVPTKSS
ncbi:agamous-like MADS-box protein AGL80 [Pyrus ussuriensis x Pyrus communis]|uniref:Agamous-like MADS-box protein AGL80 n=1 Tax=Pyrus ussuriensis x Pyrus communis TaxID=2448454 RepID=A0A5N5H2A6_9ROSA|nr:agamous-like MADS-box protein AGL80 [Pyrus ussuriensis x Pyrus communis]